MQRKRYSSFETLESRLALTTLPAGYQETLIAGEISASALSFAPDGRLFVADKFGSVWVIEDDVKLATPFFSVAVDTYSDRGLVSVLVDPLFEQNHFVYVLYTAAVSVNPNQPNNGAITKLVRLTANPNNHDVADPASEVVLVDGIPSPIGFHVGGFLRFGADNYLYVGIGDGSSNNSAQDLGSVLGKVLRIDARNPSQLIPADNPYVNTPGARGEVWAAGFRNPFSGDVDPHTGAIYINDVGQDLWEEVDILVKGANYGWPSIEGPTNDARYTNPFFSYEHFGNGAAVTGGAFYHYHGSAFPESMDGKYFAGDVAQNIIRSIDTVTAEAEIFATGVPLPTGLGVGPDGSLYYSSISSGIFKISYTGSSTTQPTALATSDVTDGLRPLVVNFSSSQSINPSGAPLLYLWDFGDGTTSTSANPQHTYTANGKYDVVLKVTDSSPGGLSSTAVPIKITVGNRAPVPTILSPVIDGTYQAGQTISFSGSATDPDSGTLPASAYEWTFLFGHNTHFHSFIGPMTGVTSGSFTIPLTGETAPDQYYRIILTVTDAQGLSKQIYRDIRAQTSDITLTTNVPGLSLNLDSHPVTTPATISAVVGMTRTLDAPYMQTVGGITYYFTNWSDGGNEIHDITVPAANRTYTANYHPASASRESEISFTPATNWQPNVAQTFSVTVKNNGTATWFATGANPTKLAVYFDGTSDAKFAWSQEPQRFTLPTNVAPGETITFMVTIAPGATLGKLVLRARLVTEGVDWFDQVASATIYSGSLLASYNQGPPPIWAQGAAPRFTVTVTNTGNTIWRASGANAVKLGVYFDAPSNAVGAWTSEPTRFLLPYDVAPGQSANIVVSLTAPAGLGNHTIRYRLVQEGVTWAQQVVANTIQVASLAAQIVGEAPAVFNPGEGKSYTLSITNTGTFPWSAGQYPVSVTTDWDAPNDQLFSWINQPVRTYLPAVQPGHTVTVAMYLVAPTTAGSHTLRTRLVMDGQSWFTTLVKQQIWVGPPGWNFSNGFNGAESQLVFNGPAAKIVGSQLQLTDGGTNQASSVYGSQQIDITRFATQFSFQLLNPNADGFTFILQGAGPTALGPNGGALGYSSSSTSTTGIKKSVAIKFDLYKNQTETNNSTGMFLNGAGPFATGSIDLTSAGIDLHSGHVFAVSLAYDGINLKATITDTVTNASATQVYTVNIPSIVGGNLAYVGFTAGTGGATAKQSILSWRYTPAAGLPAAPTGMTVAPGNGQTTLSWNPVSDAASYNIYRSATSGGEGAIPIASGVTGTSFINMGLTNGTKYYYQITAVSAAGEGMKSAEQSATPGGLDFSAGFVNSAAALQFNGASTKVVGTALQLTDAANQAASAFSKQKLDITRFTSRFDFQLTNANGDGFTFLIQGVAATAVGPAGGALGYSSGSTTTGITKSVAIKFDLYSNQGESNNSTGLYLNGAAPFSLGSIDLTSSGINLKSGRVMTVNLSYDGTTLTVSITDNATNATATQNYTVNIANIVGGSTAYLGFTGGTGGATAIQKILNWTYTPTTASPLVASGAPPTTTSSTPTLTSQALAPIVQEAILRWQAAGIGANAVALLKSVNFQIIDLNATGELGLASPGFVQIDDNGGNFGWFVDQTPKTDVEFTTKVTATELKAVAGSAVAARMDLLTVVLHELGHELGLADVAASTTAHGLMTASLSAGMRRLPAAMTAAQVTPMKTTKPQPLLARSVGEDSDLVSAASAHVFASYGLSRSTHIAESLSVTIPARTQTYQPMPRTAPASFDTNTLEMAKEYGASLEAAPYLTSTPRKKTKAIDAALAEWEK